MLVAAPARRAAACARALRLWQLAAARLSVAAPSPLLGPPPLKPRAAATAAPLAREERGSPTRRRAEPIEIAASPLFEAARRAARRGAARHGGGAAGATTAWPPSAPRIDEADEARIDEGRVLRAGPCSEQVATNRSC